MTSKARETGGKKETDDVEGCEERCYNYLESRAQEEKDCICKVVCICCCTL